MKYIYPKINVEMPGKEDVLELTPNPATKELIRHLDKQGIETFIDRFEAQQPQCGFGLSGTCCRMCQWGPCRLSEKNLRGICGKDQNTVVMSNIVRALVAGLAGHGRHEHEVLMTIISVADGKIDFPILGEQRVYELAEKFNITSENKDIKQLAKEVALVLLEDMSRMNYEPIKMLEAYAPQERKEVWQNLGVIPRSASYEIMETLHMTTLGACSDWTALSAQELRAALAYCYSTLYGSSMATEILFGIPRPKPAEVNYGVLKKDHVNILLHGHSPVMAEKILQKLRSPEIEDLVQQVGAKGIVVAGLCCTGDELLARYGIPTVTNILGQELAIGTGAVDAVVIDMQCVIPGLQVVADCYSTELITTCDSNRFPNATHIAFDPEKPETVDEDAMEVLRRAVKAFAKRDNNKVNIPQYMTKAVGGWSYEAIIEAFGGTAKLVELLKSGKIKGIATVVGCNNPKVPYENNHVTIARKLIEAGMLITTTGCCSHALLNAGLCAPEAGELAADGLKEICRELNILPVLQVGGCVDNARTLRLFIALAEKAGVAIKDMPLIFVGPEPGNEKTVGQGVSFLSHGVTNLVGFPAPIPIPMPKPLAGGGPEDMDRGSNDIADFFAGNEGVLKKVGAKIYTEPYPQLAAQTIKMHIHRKRKALGWS